MANTHANYGERILNEIYSENEEYDHSESYENDKKVFQNDDPTFLKDKSEIIFTVNN
jgi:hypothetical protein